MKSKIALSTAKLVLALAAFATVFGQPGQQLGMSRLNIGALPGARGSGSDIDFPMSQSASQLPGSAAFLQSGMVLPSDNSIDENEYIIGSGDVFFVAAVDLPTARYTAAVDQSGRAFVPNVGLINVGKVSYAEAKKAIAEFVASKLRNPPEIYVTLTQIKGATVSFTGRIRYPGSYELPGTTRLLDAVMAVNEDALPTPSDANLREVQLTRGDSTAAYDLLAYLHKGDKSQNPYLYPGDRIRVNPTTAGVFISGAVKTPISGFYPIKSGETLWEFLSMFTLDPSADTSNIFIFQSSDNTQKTVSARETYHILSNLDAITVPVKNNLPGIHTVSATGEIASPGQYPIIENFTTARQLIDMAGGAKPTGNMEQAVVIRQARKLPDRLAVGIPDLNIVRPERGASISMASASHDYTIIKLIHYNAEKVVLEPNDQVVIPKKDDFVYISGGVKNPGAYPFLRGKDHNHYITQAGGYSRNANKSNVQVFLKYGDITQSIEPQCVESGSVIVVPSAVQYKFTTQVLLPLITAIATTVGVTVSIFSLK